MDDLTSKLRRKVIEQTITRYIKEHKLEMEQFFADSKELKEAKINKWSEWQEDDVTISHMADFPKPLWEELEALLGFAPRFLGDFDERKWFANKYPEFIMRKGKGAIRRDSSARLRENES